jgi:hypothetical protein
MKYLLSFLICSSALAAPPAFVERTERQCSTIDARTANPALAEHWATPRDQDGVGWCYAYAASEVLTAATGTPVSAADLSYSYNRSIENNFFTSLMYDVFSPTNEDYYEGGFVGSALKRARRDGMCPESRLPSQSFQMSWTGDQLREILRGVQILRDQISEKSMTKQNFVDCVDCQARVRSATFQSFFPDVKAEDIFDAISTNKNKELNSVLYTLAQEQCQDQRTTPSPQLKFKNMKRKSNGAHNTFPTMDRILAAGGVVAISGPSKMYDKDMSGGHATTIVARSFRDGKCKYFVRNSWGRGCYGYNDPSFTSNDCDAAAGGIWMNEEHLKTHVREIDYAEMDN